MTGIASDWKAPRRRERAQDWQMLQKMRMYSPTEKLSAVVCTAASALMRELDGPLLTKNFVVVLNLFNIDDLLELVRIALDPATAPKAP